MEKRSEKDFNRLSLVFTVLFSLYAFYWGEFAASVGVLTGAVIAFVNIAWLKFFTSRIVQSGLPGNRASRVARVLFFLRYGLIGGILYFLAVERLVDLVGVLAGFTGVTLSLLLSFRKIAKKEKDFHGTSAAIH